MSGQSVRTPWSAARRGNWTRHPPGRPDVVLVIGRIGTGADLAVDDPSVWADHAQLRRYPGDRWVVVSLAGPVYVDGSAVGACELDDGAVFVVGQTSLVFSAALLAGAADRPAHQMPATRPPAPRHPPDRRPAAQPPTPHPSGQPTPHPSGQPTPQPSGPHRPPGPHQPSGPHQTSAQRQTSAPPHRRPPPHRPVPSSPLPTPSQTPPVPRRSSDEQMRPVRPAIRPEPPRGQPPTSDRSGLSVELRDVSVYAEHKYRLDTTNVWVAPGEFVAVIGPSGVGKSTLINVLLGEVAVDEGEVLIGYSAGGRRAAPALRRRQVHAVPQQDLLYPSLTARQTLTTAAVLRAAPDSSRAEIAQRVDEVLDLLGLTDSADRVPVGRLSGGQRRRVSIGVELVARPRLLLLDEPTSGLDPGKDRAIMKLLRRISRIFPCTVIVVTHSVTHLDETDRVLVVGNGGLVRDVGEPTTVLRRENRHTWSDLMDSLDPPGHSPRRPQRRPDLRPRGDQAAGGMSWSLSGFGAALRRQSRLMGQRGPLSLLLLCGLPVLGTLLAAFASDDGLRPGVPMTQVLAILITVAAFTGASFTYQDLVNDAPILKRDWRCGLSAFSIVAAKVTVYGTVCLLLSVVMTATFRWLRPLPDPAYGLRTTYVLFGSVFLVMLASAGLGLVISAVSGRTERAVTGNTLLAVLQVSLNGTLFQIPDFLRWAGVLPARLGLAAIANFVDLNGYLPPSSRDELWNPGFSRLCWLGGALAATVVLAGWLTTVLLERRWRRPGG